MANRGAISTLATNIDTIWSWYNDQKLALIMYREGVLYAFTISDPALEGKFRQVKIEDLKSYFRESEEELEHLYSFDIIAAIEGLLRRDFSWNVSRRKKLDVAREFRRIHKQKGKKISLETDIVETWKILATNKKNFSDLIGLLKYRHWIAHGRYWEAKFGREYNASIS